MRSSRFARRSGSRSLLFVCAALTCLVSGSDAGAQIIPPTQVQTPPTLPGASVTLAPAPNVSSHSPAGRVISGMPITITGSGFDAATIEVRLAGQKLVLLSKSSTSVVARAPRGEDGIWGLADFRAGTPLTVQSTGTQARTLNTTYKVVERWTDFQPRLVSMSISNVSGGLQGEVLNSVSFVGRVSLAGLPGNVFDSVRVGAVSGSQCGQSFRVSSQNSPSKTYTASPDGGTLGIDVLFYFAPVTLGPCQLSLPLVLHYQDTPGDMRVVTVNLGTHAVPNPRNIITVTNTYDMVSGGFLSFLDPEGGNFGICSGSAFVGGPSVGKINLSGDVAFKILTGPLGTTCVWNFPAPRLADGWSVSRYVFSETKTGSKCHVSQSGDPQDGRPVSFTFNRLTRFAGWEPVDGSALFRSGDRVQIFLTCALDLNPSAASVVSRLESVELRAPAGATDWRQGFIR
jgi:hypothetical protein